MMNVLLAVPNFNLIHASYFPVGLGYIAGLLKSRKADVRIISLVSGKDILQFRDQIQNLRPGIIGFSCVTSQLNAVKRIVKDIRGETDAFIICGGIHPTLEPEEAFKEIEGLDAVVRGEGEYAVLDLADCLEKGEDFYNLNNLWFRKKGSIIRNSLRPAIEDLDILPFPDRGSLNYQEIIDNDGGSARLLFSRGCLFDCSYCSNGALQDLYQNKYFRTRSPKRSLEEIESVLSRYKVKRLGFDDDIFTVNKVWFYDFIEEYKRKFSLPFGCNVRPGTCNQDMFKLLKESGCRNVNIGIESGDEKLRNNLLNRRISDAQIVKTFQAAHRAGLKTLSYNIIGFPGETPESFAKTIRLNAKVMPNEPYIYIYYPYPGTPLGKAVESNNGRIKRDILERAEAAFESKLFSCEDIARLYKNFVSLVYREWGIKKYILYKIADIILRLRNRVLRFLNKPLKLA